MPCRESERARGGFARALRDLPRNPLALREWRALGHQARDWRLWLGLRVPKDARGWGVPAIVWFALAPYIVIGALHLANRISPGTFRYPPDPGIPSIDALALCMGLLTIYVALIAVGLMAPAITRERERDTWESLRATTASAHDIVLGLLAGRLGPVIAALVAVGAAWVTLRPHYAPLLQPLAPFTLDAGRTALLVSLAAAAAVGLGTLATAASARCRATPTALVVASTGILALAGVTLVAALSGLAEVPSVLLGTAAALTLGSYLVAVRGVEAS